MGYDIFGLRHRDPVIDERLVAQIQDMFSPVRCACGRIYDLGQGHGDGPVHGLLGVEGAVLRPDRRRSGARLVCGAALHGARPQRARGAAVSADARVARAIQDFRRVLAAPPADVHGTSGTWLGELRASADDLLDEVMGALHLTDDDIAQY